MPIRVRCEREAPHAPWTVGNGWLTMMDESGKDHALVCPECLTPAEQAAVANATGQ